jgi:hypothetical protein
MTPLPTDWLALLTEADEIEEELDEEEEELWWQASGLVAAQYSLKYYCTILYRTAPYTSDSYI